MGVGGERQPAECPLGSFLVVFPTSSFDDHPDVRQTGEPVLAQTFHAEPSAE